MANLDLWEKVRAVPSTAIKPINGGRLRGMSDINPVWRQKMLTELFGPCGIGWKYTISKQWLETGGNDEIAAFVNIELFFKHEGAWSEAIPGTGGSAFVTKEKSGPYTSDECFKMALTDAISVACKALGFGADVYWDKDNTKYNKPLQAAQKGQEQTRTEQPRQQTIPPPQSRPEPPKQQPATGYGRVTDDLSSEAQHRAIHTISKQKKIDIHNILGRDYGVESTKELTKKQASELIDKLQKTEVA